MAQLKVIKMKLIKILLTSIIASCLSFSAQATTFDFEELAQNETDSLQQGYTAEGFKISVIAGSLKIARPGDSTYMRSTALYNSSEGGQTQLKKTDNTSFNLSSIDLAASDVNNSGSKEIIFTTNLGHSQVFTIHAGVQTISFGRDFKEINSVDWRQGRYKYQFDNIRVNIATKTYQGITNFVATPATGTVNSSSTLSATGGRSNNSVTFGSSTPTVCTISGSTVSYSKPGTCTVYADQAGNAYYEAAQKKFLKITVKNPPSESLWKWIVFVLAILAIYLGPIIRRRQLKFYADKGPV